MPPPGVMGGGGGGMATPRQLQQLQSLQQGGFATHGPSPHGTPAMASPRLAHGPSMRGGMVVPPPAAAAPLQRPLSFHGADVDHLFGAPSHSGHGTPEAHGFLPNTPDSHTFMLSPEDARVPDGSTPLYVAELATSAHARTSRILAAAAVVVPPPPPPAYDGVYEDEVFIPPGLEGYVDATATA